MKVKAVPNGKRISHEDDYVVVYDSHGYIVYHGLFDDCPYKYEDYTWNEDDRNYDLPKNYKMVGL